MEKRAMCFVCRLSFDTTHQSGVFFGNEISRIRKQECADTISHLLLGSSYHPLHMYFQSAAYCNRCTKIILDVNFSWSQLTALENRMSHNLKVLRILFRKNFEGISNKVDVDIPDEDPENSQEWESFTYDQVIQICMKVMHVEDEDSVLHPDQIHTVDPNEYLKTHFEEVNDEDAYFYLNSFEGEVKESEVVGNLVGSSDRIQIYAKDDDTDSSFEVSSDTSDSSSYCSSNSGGRPKRKNRKKPTVGIVLPNTTDANAGTGVSSTSIPLQAPNGPTSSLAGDSSKVTLNSQSVPGANSGSHIQKPIGGVPVQIASINQVVSSEFLKKFPIPIDKNKIAAEAKIVVPPTPIQVKPVLPLPLISNVKPEITNNDTKPPVTSVTTGSSEASSEGSQNQPKASETNFSHINVNLPHTTIIPVINFKPKPVPVASITNTNTESQAAVKPQPPIGTVKQPPELSAASNIKNVNSSANVNRQNHNIPVNNTRRQVNVSGNYRQNNSRFPHGNNRPGPSSQMRGRGSMKNMATKRNYKLAQPPRRSTRSKRDKKLAGHDSDSSSKSVLSCSSFSSDSISSGLDSSSDDNSLYPSKTLAKLQKRKKKSGNCSSSSSIVVISD